MWLYLCMYVPPRWLNKIIGLCWRLMMSSQSWHVVIEDHIFWMMPLNQWSAKTHGVLYWFVQAGPRQPAKLYRQYINAGQPYRFLYRNWWQYWHYPKSWNIVPSKSSEHWGQQDPYVIPRFGKYFLRWKPCNQTLNSTLIYRQFTVSSPSVYCQFTISFTLVLRQLTFSHQVYFLLTKY